MTSYNKPKKSTEIEGYHEQRSPIELFAKVLLVLIIFSSGIGLLSYILSGTIVNAVRTGNTSKISHQYSVFSEFLIVISALLLLLTLILALYFIAIGGFARFRHLPHGYTLEEHHAVIDAYGEVKANPTRDQMDVNPSELNRRENAAILEWGGKINNKELDLSEYKSGLTNINTASGDVYLSPQGIRSTSSDSKIVSSIQTSPQTFSSPQFRPQPNPMLPHSQFQQSAFPTSMVSAPDEFRSILDSIRT